MSLSLRFDLNIHDASHQKIGEGLRCRQFESECPEGLEQSPENNLPHSRKKLRWTWRGMAESIARQCRISPICKVFGQYQFRLL
jgi:hypothetical protein